MNYKLNPLISTRMNISIRYVDVVNGVRRIYTKRKAHLPDVVYQEDNEGAIKDLRSKKQSFPATDANKKVLDEAGVAYEIKGCNCRGKNSKNIHTGKVVEVK